MVRSWRSQIADETRACSLMKPKPTITPLEDPQHCIGAYDFHAYCKYENKNHDYNESPHIAPMVQTLAQSKRVLKKHGWLFHRDGTGTCPKCAVALKGQQHDK